MQGEEENVSQGVVCGAMTGCSFPPTGKERGWRDAGALVADGRTMRSFAPFAGRSCVCDAPEQQN